jgi:membrane associated rhomboid family serine protease
MFPLYDEEAPSIDTPYVTIALIVIIVLIFAVTFLSSQFEHIILKYGLIPNVILRGEGILTLITSLFLHAGIIHVVGNIWFLWLFGDNVEYNLGHIRYIIFFILVGIIAGLVHTFFAPAGHADIPAIGASGAISGLMGGYVVLFPKNKIRAFFLLLFRPLFFDVPAFVYVGVWFLYQLLYIGASTSIAFMAHIGGFIGGMILISLFKRKITRIDFLKDGDVVVDYEKIKI